MQTNSMESTEPSTPNPTGKNGGAAGLPPASAELLRDLRKAVKRKGLVIWMDADGVYSQFAQRLKSLSSAKGFPFSVFAFEGSFLKLMLETENLNNGLKAEDDYAVIHLPGFNDQTIAETPLFELYKAGSKFRKKLSTLAGDSAAGIAHRKDVEEFLAKGDVQLESLDRWLSSSRTSGGDAFALALESRTPQATLVELCQQSGAFIEALGDDTKQAQFLSWLGVQLGLPDPAWREFCLGDAAKKLQAVDWIHFVGSWLMCVEYVHDLREAPVNPTLQQIVGLAKPLRLVCLELIASLRDQYPEIYAGVATELEERLADERQGQFATGLGRIDTFSFEEQTIRRAALDGLLEADWAGVLNFANSRKPDTCFWVRKSSRLEDTWKLITLTAEAGRAIAQDKKGLAGCGSLEEAIQRYRDKLSLIDLAHRRFEQGFPIRLLNQLEDDAPLRRAREIVRRHYRDWADKVSREFADLCDKYGPLPPADLQQRHFFEQFVSNRLNADERVAVFMVDAMRFEMAAELANVLEGKRYKAKLHARFAELPTNTVVGMNVLAPVVENGHLSPVIRSRKFGGFQVSKASTAKPVQSAQQRVQAMKNRTPDDRVADYALKEVLGMSRETLKRSLSASTARLITVRSLEIDSAGEKDLGLSNFEHTMRQIEEAVHQLYRAGVNRFVLVSDHGFLLQDSTTEQVEYGDSPSRRHVLSPRPSGMSKSEVLEIPLSALKYRTNSEDYLIFRRDTAVWKCSESIPSFVHGGNSLQERVIPVLELERSGKAGKTTTKYEIVARAERTEHGRHKLTLRLQVQTGQMLMAGPSSIALALRVPGQDVIPKIVEVSPPGELRAGTVAVPPKSVPVTISFLLEGEIDEKVRVEVYHPEGSEEVVPRLVDGFFHVQERRGAPRAKADEPDAALEAETTDSAETPASSRISVSDNWSADFEDEDFAEAFRTIDRAGSINEQELREVLKGPTKVRAFARRFDDLKTRVPFDVEIAIVGVMKTYLKGSKK